MSPDNGRLFGNFGMVDPSMPICPHHSTAPTCVEDDWSQKGKGTGSLKVASDDWNGSLIYNPKVCKHGHGTFLEEISYQQNSEHGNSEKPYLLHGLHLN